MKMHIPPGLQRYKWLFLLVLVLTVICVGALIFAFVWLWLQGNGSHQESTPWDWVRGIIILVGTGLAAITTRMSLRLNRNGVRQRKNTHSTSSDGHTAQKQPAAISHGTQRDRATTEENG
jgi:TRAP-type C4-dicarboxylate transport system permease small subunit